MASVKFLRASGFGLQDFEHMALGLGCRAWDMTRMYTYTHIVMEMTTFLSVYISIAT